MRKKVCFFLILAVLIVAAVSAYAAGYEQIVDFESQRTEDGFVIRLPAGYAEKGFFKLFWRNEQSGEVQSEAVSADTTEYLIKTTDDSEYSFQLFYAKKRGLLPANWKEEKQENAEPEGPSVWKVLWIDVDSIEFEGIHTAMTEDDHKVSEEMSKRFEQFIEETTGGLVDIEITLKHLPEPLTKLTYDDLSGYYITQSDINMKHYAMYKYDSVLVTARMDGFKTDYWGLAFEQEGAIEEPGYAIVMLDDRGKTDKPLLAEVYVHEWIHQLELFYKRFELLIPNPDDSEKYSYKRKNGGFNHFYADILGNKVKKEDGKTIGVPPEAWRYKPTARPIRTNLSYMQGK